MSSFSLIELTRRQLGFSTPNFFLSSKLRTRPFLNSSLISSATTWKVSRRSRQFSMPWQYIHTHVHGNSLSLSLSLSLVPIDILVGRHRLAFWDNYADWTRKREYLNVSPERKNDKCQARLFVCVCCSLFLSDWQQYLSWCEYHLLQEIR